MLLQHFADIPNLLPQNKKQKSQQDSQDDTFDGLAASTNHSEPNEALAPTVDVDEMIKQWPHRSAQIRHLHGILAAARSPPAPFLLSGPSGTGKSDRKSTRLNSSH